MTDTLARFLAHLHRGGAWAYWWTLEGRRSTWWPAARPLPIPRGAVNVYFGVHPTSRPGSSSERATNGKVSAVNCLFADLDAAGFGGKAQAAAHVKALEPGPSVVVDSGGGYHAYWLLADPFLLRNDKDRARARELQARWVGLVGGDTGAKDLARVLRVPGTRNYKPDYAPDFPEVRFVRCDLARLYSLADLAALLPMPTRRQAPGPATVTNAGAYALAALAGELGRLASAKNGARNHTLNACAFSLGTLTGAGLLDRAEVASLLESRALVLGLGEREAQATIASGLAAGELKPRAIPAGAAQ